MSAYADDAALAMRAQAHEFEAENQLYNKYRPLMGCWARRWLRRRDYAAEVADEAVALLFEQLPRFNPSRGSFRSWAYRLTETRCLMFLRALRRRPEEQLSGTELEAVPSGRTVEEQCLERLVRARIAELPSGVREVVQDRLVEGLPSRAVQAHLGVSERAIRYRQRRGISLLRRSLGPSRVNRQAQRADKSQGRRSKDKAGGKAEEGKNRSAPDLVCLPGFPLLCPFHSRL